MGVGSRMWSIMRLAMGLGGMLLILGLFWAVDFDMPGAADNGAEGPTEPRRG